MFLPKILILVPLFLVGCVTGMAENGGSNYRKITEATEQSVAALDKVLVDLCSTRMRDTQYIVKNATSVSKPTVELPRGWDGVKDDPRLKEYTYRMTTDEGDNTKVGRVILFNPSAELLAAWIYNAVKEASADQATYDHQKAKQLLETIIGSSGAQFPVVGTVWENIYDSKGAYYPRGTPEAKKDKIAESFAFIDGVTAKGAPEEYYLDLETLKRNSKKLSDPALHKAMTLRWGDAYPGEYARISGVTVGQIKKLYKRMGSAEPNLEGIRFPDFVRIAYIEAMKGSRNELLVAQLH